MPSRVRLEQIKPSTEHARGYEVLNDPQPFGSSNVGPAPPIVPGPPGSKTDSIFLIAGIGGETVNVSGEDISIAYLRDINPNLADAIYILPGAEGDNNNVQWKVPVPANMRPGSPLRIFMHLIGKPTGGGPTPPPGGDGVFTGAQVASVASSGQTINDGSDQQITTVLLDSTILDTGTSQFGADYWDAGNNRFEIPAGAGSAESMFIIIFEANWDISNPGYGMARLRSGSSFLDFDYQIIDSNAFGCRVRLVAEALLADGDTVFVDVNQDTSGSATRDITDGQFFIGRYDYIAP